MAGLVIGRVLAMYGAKESILSVKNSEHFVMISPIDNGAQGALLRMRGTSLP
jgi:hypothetical protein